MERLRGVGYCLALESADRAQLANLAGFWYKLTGCVRLRLLLPGSWFSADSREWTLLDLLPYSGSRC